MNKQHKPLNLTLFVFLFAISIAYFGSQLHNTIWPAKPATDTTKVVAPDDTTKPEIFTGTTYIPADTTPFGVWDDNLLDHSHITYKDTFRISNGGSGAIYNLIGFDSNCIKLYFHDSIIHSLKIAIDTLLKSNNSEEYYRPGGGQGKTIFINQKIESTLTTDNTTTLDPKLLTATIGIDSIFLDTLKVIYIFVDTANRILIDTNIRGKIVISNDTMFSPLSVYVQDNHIYWNQGYYIYQRHSEYNGSSAIGLYHQPTLLDKNFVPVEKNKNIIVLLTVNVDDKRLKAN